MISTLIAVIWKLSGGYSGTLWMMNSALETLRSKKLFHRDVTFNISSPYEQSHWGKSKHHQWIIYHADNLILRVDQRLVPCDEYRVNCAWWPASIRTSSPIKSNADIHMPIHTPMPIFICPYTECLAWESWDANMQQYAGLHYISATKQLEWVLHQLRELIINSCRRKYTI